MSDDSQSSQAYLNLLNAPLSPEQHTFCCFLLFLKRFSEGSGSSNRIILLVKFFLSRRVYSKPFSGRVPVIVLKTDSRINTQLLASLAADKLIVNIRQ